jgi:hypothetical protein
MYAFCWRNEVYSSGEKMRFFKTLEQQAKEAGFVYIGGKTVFTDDVKEVFDDFAGKEIAQIIRQHVAEHDSVRNVYIHVEKVPKVRHKREVCSSCSNGYYVRIFVPK